MFATPLWLAALATLAIPLVLHLWSRRPRRLVRVGSVRHLSGLPEARARSARLAQPLLLLLRLLILAAVVFALAGPRIRGTPLGLPSALVLVDPALFGDPVLDSLEAAHAAVRLLVDGLPEATLPMRLRGRPVARPWAALREADGLVARGGTLHVYARPRLVTLDATRPALHAAVVWHAPAPAPATRWVADLARAPHDSLAALLGEGDAAGVTWQALRVADTSALPAPVGRAPRDLARRRVALPGLPAGDSALARASLAAVGEALGEEVELAGSAGIVLTLDPATIAPGALADTLLARWPTRPDRDNLTDPREVAIREALPAAAAPGLAAGAPAPARTRELLLLAALLLLLERWLATRPRPEAR